uniref:Clp R domain-containing protein n=1 Tax=Nelumbo nucifera TaxID=4432 RepID=A0A822ZVD3_NELNU|nr:TPA_asm: hypothetical protein HUJ06_004098 [Nelumbo nucifera]
MRAGACTVQQTLTSEAASVLKHSLGLARRRGHAQVTPLHVAATLLSPRASLLRRACLKSHPHSTSHPLLHGQPSLSNALIAALKRAQAHQRRGCIEQQQQQPLLAIKVELEQLIISILDDPSVSRVMREAGFSSTSVKNNLEDSSASVFQCYSSSGGVFSSPNSPPTETHRDIINHSTFWQTHLLNCYSEQNPVLFSTPKKNLGNHVRDSATEKEDVRVVLEVLLRKKRRNTVVVGDSVSTTEGLVAELMAKVERGEVPDELRSVHFIKFQFSSVSLRFMKREDVEMKVSDLRRKVGSLASGGGAIIYAGDLKWTVETNSCDRDGGFSVGEVDNYSPVDHLIAEIGRLISDYSCSNSKVWLMATANYQTYMRCQMKQPPLEILWTLQAVSVPSGGLGLSLHASSALDSRMTLTQNPSQLLEVKPFAKEEQERLTCCAECTSNFEREAGLLKSGYQKPSSLCNTKDMEKGSTNLPYWLQPHRTNTHHKDDLVELRRKWNRLCQSIHHPRPDQTHLGSSFLNNLRGKSYNYASSYSWWSTGSQYNQNSVFADPNSISFTETPSKPNHKPNFLSQFGTQQSCSIEFGSVNGMQKNQPPEPNLDFLRNTDNKDVKITLALGNSLFSDSITNQDQKREGTIDSRDLCKLLKENVPWQSEIIPSIAEALLSSRCKRNKGTWLLIQGTDWIGKRRLALGTAEFLCGSADHLVHMNMRRKEDEGVSFSNILTKALRNHNKCVVLIEDIDYADDDFVKFLANILESSNGEDPIDRDLSFDQAIFIVTTSCSKSYMDRNKKEDIVIQMKLQVEETTPSLGALNPDHKRKAEWDLSNKIKNPRKGEKEDVSSVSDDNGSNKRELSRQLSSNTLDLNIRAEEEEEEEDNKPNEAITDLKDMTREISHGFLESIEKRFILNEKATLLDQMTESFMAKIKGSFEEVYGSERGESFCVDRVVLEEVVVGSCSFLNSLFEKWLKAIFQTSLETVKKGGKEGTVKLLFGGKRESVVESGFMDSSLPNTIQVAYKE